MKKFLKRQNFELYKKNLKSRLLLLSSSELIKMMPKCLVAYAEVDSRTQRLRPRLKTPKKSEPETYLSRTDSLGAKGRNG